MSEEIKKIEKPFNLIINDTKENLLNVINESNLPIMVTQMIVSELLNTINNIATNQLKVEKSEYETKLNENNKKD